MSDKGPLAAGLAAHRVERTRSSARRTATFWERRYVLKHFRSCSNDTLSRGSELPMSEVVAVLESNKATRSLGDENRIRKARSVEPPLMLTPRVVLDRATMLDTRVLGRRDAWCLGAMFVLSLMLYAGTAATTVTGEDAGELLGAAHGLGVPHPPGYPLWTLLGHALDRGLPFGTAAWRITLVSGLFSALANTLLLALCLKTLKSRLAAVTAAGLFAVSLTHWTQAVIPEVYGLNTFFVAACALLLVRLAEKPTPGRLLALAVVSGLALTNHTTALATTVLCAVGAVLVAPRLFRRPLVAGGALALCLAPLALYLLLPVFSASDPYVDWGNPETTSALWEHVSRQQYAGSERDQQAVAADYGSYLKRLGLLASSMTEQFGGPWVIAFAIVGFYVLLVRQTGLWLYLMASGYLCSVAITQLTAYSFDREHIYANQIFFIPAWLTLAWLVGGGIDGVLWLVRQASALSPRTVQRVAAAACVALLAYPAWSHYPQADRSETRLIADYGKALLDAMDEGALYFPASDHSTFAVMYWQGVEGYRTDIVIADKYGRFERDLVEPFIDDTDRQHLNEATSYDEQRRRVEALLIERWPGPVYFANKRAMDDLPELRCEPRGPLFEIMAAEEAEAWWQPGEEGELSAGLAFWSRFDHLDLEDEREGLDFTVQMVRGDLRYLRGFAHVRAGDLDGAVAEWSMIEADLAPLKQLFNNIGSALADHDRLPEALTFYERALSEDPEYVLGLRNKASVHVNLGQLSSAIGLYERMLTVDPGHRDARLKLADLLEQQGRPSEALYHLEALALADLRDPVPWKLAGGVLLRGGDLAKAEDAFAEALERAPHDDELAERLQFLRSGAALLAQQAVPDIPAAADPLFDPFGDPLSDDFGAALSGPPQAPGARAPTLPDPTPRLPAPGGLTRPPGVPTGPAALSSPHGLSPIVGSLPSGSP